jgi:hypothetical protein
LPFVVPTYCGVARWHIFEPKNPIGVIFGGSCNVGVFYEHLVDFTAICSILRPFGIFYGYLVYFSRFGMLYQENLAPLMIFVIFRHDFCQHQKLCLFFFSTEYVSEAHF